MSEIIFAKTRHIYDSYLDFWWLVELSGFPTCYVDEIDMGSNNIYITAPMNGDYEAHLANHINEPREAHLILWNLERPSGSTGSIGEYTKRHRQLIYDRYLDEVWVSDRRLAEETHHCTRFVVLGSDEGLGEPGSEKRYDLCHMSYEVPRRQSIYKHFGESSIGPNCWPPERDKILSESRFALNVHQDQHPFQEPLRFALFAAYGLPIVSEKIFDAWPWVNDETIIMTTYDGLVGKLKQMLENDYQRWRDFGLKARDRMIREFRFKDMVEQAVYEGVKSKWR